MSKTILNLSPTLIITLLFLFPIEFVNAQGFLTCDGVDCSACNLVDTANIVIKWLFGIIFMIFAVMMMIAGFKLVTSGGNTSALEDAKSKFTNAIIGLIIVMAAWLLVDTIMRGLLKGGTGEIENYGPWADVQCQTQTMPIAFYDLNTGQGGVSTGTSTGQVPGSTNSGSCSVPALSAITDPLANQMEQGQSVIFNNPTLKQCAEKFVSLVPGARINSAYRPQSYQNHLWEISDRWCTKGLRNNNDQACSALKTAIGSEVSKHFGSGWSCGAVARSNSNHARNTAVDIGGISNHSAPSVQQAANDSCLVWKNYRGDPWHYELKSGCTCN